MKPIRFAFIVFALAYNWQIINFKPIPAPAVGGELLRTIASIPAKRAAMIEYTIMQFGFDINLLALAADIDKRPLSKAVRFEPEWKPSHNVLILLISDNTPPYKILKQLNQMSIKGDLNAILREIAELQNSISGKSVVGMELNGGSYTQICQTNDNNTLFVNAIVRKHPLNTTFLASDIYEEIAQDLKHKTQ